MRFAILGEPQLLRLSRMLALAGRPVRVVAREPHSYRDLGVEAIPDAMPRRRPMGGLLGALEDAAPVPWILCVACGLVGIRRRWLRALFAARGPEVCAVVYRTDRCHPLLVAYRTDLRREVRRRVAARDLTLQRLLEEIPAAVADAAPDSSTLVNLNRPEDARLPTTCG